MSSFLEDIRVALRRLAREPLLTGLLVATLGFGIGANTAIFSFVNALLLRPYPFPDLDALVTLWERHPQQGGRSSVRPSDGGYPIAAADFLDLRRETRAFEGLAAFRHRDVTLTGSGEPERVMSAVVSPELFRLLRVQAAQGRTLLPEEAEAGRDAVVVVSHGLWQRRLGGAEVLGRPLLLNGRAHVVVGVMPPDFAYPAGGVELWLPLVFAEQDKSERQLLSLRALGRLLPGVSLDALRAELLEVASSLQKTYPRTNAGRTFAALLLREQQAAVTAPFAALFQAAALVVLLIACANVSGVLLARGLARRREMALRAVLGASRWRVARQLLTESLALSLLAGLVASAVAAAGVRAIRESVPPDITKWVLGWSQIRLDERALLFGLVAAVLTALLTGISPAWGAARLRLGDELHAGGRGATARARWRSLIVVSQVAMALVLLVAASLLVSGSARVSERYQGFDPEGVLTFRIRLTEARYPGGRATSDLYERMLEQLGAIPGVERAAVVAQLPGDLGPTPSGTLSIRGRSAPGDLDLPASDYQPVSPGYFEALGVRVLAGRAFVARDGAEAPAVAIVSRGLAQRLWPAGDALGQQVKTGKPDDPGPWREVIGIADDVTQYWFDREPRSTLYLPHPQAPRASMFVLVRARGDAALLTRALRARVAAVDPELPIDEVRTLRRVVDDGTAILALAVDLLLVLGGVALALSALGVYGVLARDVTERTREMGVRLALGAAPSEVRLMVLKRALRLSGAALLIGVPAAFALSRALASALFGVVRPEPMLVALYASGLAATALVASWAPAWRASRVDPVIALRSE